MPLYNIITESSSQTRFLVEGETKAQAQLRVEMGTGLGVLHSAVVGKPIQRNVITVEQIDEWK